MGLGITLTLYNGTAPQLSVTDLTALWWELGTGTAFNINKPQGRLTGGTTDASGVINIGIDNIIFAATAGSLGLLTLYKYNTAESRDSLVFTSEVTVADLGTTTSQQLLHTDYDFTGYTGTAGAAGWTRPTEWSALGTSTTGDEIVQGLVHVIFGPETATSNWITVDMTIAGAGSNQFVVDWGDGTTPGTGASTDMLEHSFLYANCSGDLTIGTSEGCSFTDTGDLVTTTSPFIENELILFGTITSTTGISTDQCYYAVNVSGTTLQVASTLSGTALPLTTDGTGTIVRAQGVRQSVVTMTPYDAGDTISAFDLTQSPTNPSTAYDTNHHWIEVKSRTPNRISSSLIYSSANFKSSIRRVEILEDGYSSPPFSNNFYSLESISMDCSSYTSLGGVFNSAYSLVDVNFTNTGSVTSLAGTFNACYSLTTVPLFDTSSVTSMNNMFYGCNSLTTVPLFDTSSVTNMGSMFYGCYSLTTIPLFDTSLVSSMGSMFYNCYSLTTIPLLNTSSLVSMDSMFRDCNSLTTVPLLDTSSVTNMNNLFYICYSLATVPLLDTSSVTTMAYMFYGCNSLTTVPLFDTSSVTSMSNMFNGCNALTTVPLFDTSSVTYMDNMFINCNSLTTVPLFNTGTATTMAGMFNACYSLATVPLFDTSSVTNMGSMFYGCRALTTIPLFDTSSVTYMGSMFRDCYSLATIPLLDTSSVTNMSGTFYNCYSLATIPLLDTSSVTTLDSMFRGCFVLESIPNLNTQNCSDFDYMFYGCTSLKSIPRLDTGTATTMSNMFYNCYSLETVPQMDTSNVTNMTSMFRACYNLKHIPALDQSSVTSCNTFAYQSYAAEWCDVYGLTSANVDYRYNAFSSEALNHIYTLLGTADGARTIYVGTNPGIAGDDPTIATDKGWTVSG